MLSQEKNHWLRLAAISLLLALFAACSGGGIGAERGNNDPGPVTDPGDGGGDDPGDPPPATVASVALLASSASLRSDADSPGEGVTLTALVRDSANNAIPDQVVSFSTSATDGGSISPSNPTTDSNGFAQVEITTGGDARNRRITVTARSGGQSDSLQLAVGGTTLAINGPSSIGSGDVANFSATLLNAGSEGISFETVTISSSAGNTLSSTSLETDENGIVEFTLTGDLGGTDTLTVSALGITSTQTVVVSAFDASITAPADGTQVELGTNQTIEATLLQNGAAAAGQPLEFSTTRGTLTVTSGTTDANGMLSTQISSNGPGSAGPAIVTVNGPEGSSNQINLQFVAADPASINVQASPDSVPVNGSSQIRAVVRDANNNLVANQTVDFSLTDSTGGALSAGQATTNSQGLATVTYTAGGVNSGSEDVVVRAGIDTDNDGDIDANDVQNTTNLTVGGQALRVVIGTGNTIFEPNETQYQQPFTVIITDAAGNPAPASTQFRVQILHTEFRTGRYVATDVDNPPDGEPDEFVQFVVDQCPSEDLNNNGILDAADNDANNNGLLEPFAAATAPGDLTLDENGSVQFNVTYPQDHNGWTQIRLTATATVSGTESSNSTTFYLQGLASDFSQVDVPPPGVVSPYGADDGDVPDQGC